MNNYLLQKIYILYNLHIFFEDYKIIINKYNIKKKNKYTNIINSLIIQNNQLLQENIKLKNKIKENEDKELYVFI